MVRLSDEQLEISSAMPQRFDLAIVTTVGHQLGDATAVPYAALFHRQLQEADNVLRPLRSSSEATDKQASHDERMHQSLVRSCGAIFVCPSREIGEVNDNALLEALVARQVGIVEGDRKAM